VTLLLVLWFFHPVDGAMLSSETSVLTRATRHHIPVDGIAHPFQSTHNFIFRPRKQNERSWRSAEFFLWSPCLSKMENVIVACQLYYSCCNIPMKHAVEYFAYVFVWEYVSMFLCRTWGSQNCASDEFCISWIWGHVVRLKSSDDTCNSVTSIFRID
jgi:hypothetical protein